VVSANAFAWQDACWETSEAQVVAATALLIGASTEADGTVGLDAVNFSLGAEGHELSTAMSVEPVLLRVTFEELIAALAASGTEVYAAAGNSPPDPNRPIYPAAYDGVIGVGATDSLDRPTVWDHSTPITGFTPGVWMDFGAPGCDLVAVATTAGLVAAADGHPEEVVLWSGSSFASPIAAAIGATSDVPQAQFAGVLYPDPPSPEVSQCATE
jgi:hypothetical protein